MGPLSPPHPLFLAPSPLTLNPKNKKFYGTRQYVLDSQLGQTAILALSFCLVAEFDHCDKMVVENKKKFGSRVGIN
jgi:hypothetical protein